MRRALAAAALLLAWPAVVGAQPASTTVPIRFESSSKGDFLTLHVEGTPVFSPGGFEPGWDPLCTSPCSWRLPRGKQRLALSRGDGEPVEVSEPIDLTRPSVLRGTYQSATGTRVFGYTLMALGPALGVATYAETTSCEAEDDEASGSGCEGHGTQRAVAATLFFGGLIGGILVVALASGTAHLEVLPMSVPSSSDAAPAMDRIVPRGLEVAYRF